LDTCGEDPVPQRESQLQTFPQRLKAAFYLGIFTARVELVPFPFVLNAEGHQDCVTEF